MEWTPESGGGRSAAWPDAAGAVLAGGRSTRMGQDKASLLLPDGTSLLERAWRLLSALVAPAWVCCAPGSPRPGYPCRIDEKAGEGPARGVAAALAAAREHGAERVLIVACDLPLLTSELLAVLLNAPARPGALATVYANAEIGKAEMLAGVYRVEALSALREGLARGERSLYRLIGPERLACVPCRKIDAALFLNCNTPADLARLREEL